jgi:CheY-like chemotaxis protein/anti-sigma regulatory factor (Ser/Thr protein kinase)
MSHELRTPLNGILGFAHLLRKRGDDPGGEARMIEESGLHLLALIDELLELTRIEAGLRPLRPAPLELRALLEGTVAVACRQADGDGAKVELELDGALPELVTADAKVLRQVLFNLIGNAIKYGGQSRIRVTVRLTEQQRSGPGQTRCCIRFEVADQGPGISREKQATIFQPFERGGAEEGKIQGLGLGLTISHHLVARMGGELGLFSQPGRGSRFHFELWLPQTDQPVAPQPLPVRTIQGFEGPPRRLLIVDDQQSNRRVLRGMLEPLGFDIDEAEDGATALACIATTLPDLVLLDLRMPGLDGFEVVGRIRAQPRCATLPIFAVSASLPEENGSLFDGFIHKPVMEAPLLEQIGKRLGLSWIYPPCASNSQPGIGIKAALPPQQELERLAQFAHIGNARKVIAWSKAIERQDPAYHAFAREVRALADRFAWEELEQRVHAAEDQS